MTPVASERGSTIITLQVSDGELSTTDTFVLSVGALPTVSDVADQVTDEDTPLGGVAFTIGDAETAPDQLIVTATSSDQTLLPDANLVIGGTGADRTLQLTPALNQFGSATVTLHVSDGVVEAL
jgi:hypothetical protein